MPFKRAQVLLWVFYLILPCHSLFQVDDDSEYETTEEDVPDDLSESEDSNDAEEDIGDAPEEVSMGGGGISYNNTWSIMQGSINGERWIIAPGDWTGLLTQTISLSFSSSLYTDMVTLNFFLSPHNSLVIRP